MQTTNDLLAILLVHREVRDNPALTPAVRLELFDVALDEYLVRPRCLAARDAVEAMRVALMPQEPAVDEPKRKAARKAQ